MWNSTAAPVQTGSTSSTNDPSREPNFQHQEEDEEEEEELLQESGGRYQGEYYGELPLLEFFTYGLFSIDRICTLLREYPKATEFLRIQRVIKHHPLLSLLRT